MSKKTYNVYTHYDTQKRVIARIRPKRDECGWLYISKRTYNKLMKERVIGGIAGVYHDADDYIWVKNSNGVNEFCF